MPLRGQSEIFDRMTSIGAICDCSVVNLLFSPIFGSVLLFGTSAGAFLLQWYAVRLPRGACHI
jgi:hypothetical protein